MRNIVLIGFMGSGKSTIAHLLAHKLCLPFVDSDNYIEEQEQQSIKDIFAQKGEAYFRGLELQFIESFSKKNSYIIATGGGMPIFHDISTLGVCFYLQSDFDMIRARIEQQEKEKGAMRPLFCDTKKALKLYNERAPLYEEAADYIIDSTQDIESIIAHIIEILCERNIRARHATT